MATILQITNADKNLSTLAKGLKAVELEDTLNGIGPFTILAPVNLAFGNMTPVTFEDMLKQNNNNGKLASVLGYHILKGKKLLKDFRDGQKLMTINGQEVGVTIKNDEVRIDGAKILSRDRQGSNGVVHYVDTVNIPVG